MPAAGEVRFAHQTLWWRVIRTLGPGKRRPSPERYIWRGATENLSRGDRVFRAAGGYSGGDYTSVVGARISTGRRTRQILSVSSVAPVSWWPRQQAKERIRIAAGAPFENRADNKLARMCVVMLHVKTVALIFSTCFNGAVTPQHTVVVLKCALHIEKFDH